MITLQNADLPWAEGRGASHLQASRGSNESAAGEPTAPCSCQTWVQLTFIDTLPMY
jgi:hypothetical protein